MDLDLTQLTPAPWKAHDDVAGNITGPGLDWCAIAARKPNREFIALARNAFDVQMRRGWSAFLCMHGWFAAFENGDTVESLCTLKENRSESGRALRFFADPFTALVEADKWYRENVEKKCAPS